MVLREKLIEERAARARAGASSPGDLVSEGMLGDIARMMANLLPQPLGDIPGGLGVPSIPVGFTKEDADRLKRVERLLVELLKQKGV